MEYDPSTVLCIGDGGVVGSCCTGISGIDIIPEKTKPPTDTATAIIPITIAIPVLLALDVFELKPFGKVSAIDIKTDFFLTT